MRKVNKKKKWDKPKLVILTRGEPAERVLVSCKVKYVTSGPGAADWLCENYSYGMCQNCSQYGSS
ncbi:MAG: hypothetical protein KKC39_07410 [Candidatus Omnitrophica bacterium]|nr:hypothetical protein [Candidatus Omnitrophota bacterium]MBU4468546.1 hypothetical protein [Candidatus Omnitrophota bacterium]MCG2707761.1 hypothetical protein [Candidatus Omnitrophota bacterium]